MIDRAGLLMGGVFLLFGLGFAALFVVSAGQRLALLDHGVETDAQVLEFYEEVSSDTSDRYVRVSYFAPEPGQPTSALHPGKMYFGRERATARIQREHPEGSTVRIVYLPEQPEIRRLVGGSVVEEVGLVFGLLVGVGIAGLGVVFMWRARSPGRAASTA